LAYLKEAYLLVALKMAMSRYINIAITKDKITPKQQHNDVDKASGSILTTKKSLLTLKL
jgi:hypothetical protein